MDPDRLGIILSLLTRLALPVMLALALGVGTACSTEAEPKGSATVDVIHDLPVQGPVEGHELGQQSPEFTLRLADDTTLTLTQLMDSGRPTFLFFWATT